MQKEIEVIIKGRVQMVMFRDFAKKEADSLKLCGTVKNLGDGSVDVIAQGDEEKLKEFIEKLKTGPKFAEVENVEIQWRDIKERFNDFKIIWT